MAPWFEVANSTERLGGPVAVGNVSFTSGFGRFGICMPGSSCDPFGFHLKSGLAQPILSER
jgi:hypothetical protein